MTPEEDLFIAVGNKIEGAEKSQMFGKPCFKINGKAFICLFEKSMVFKLNGDAHQEALSLDGSQLFDPSDKNRPMKEWIQVSYHHAGKWEKFANAAVKYVDGK